MSAPPTGEAEKNIEIWKVKKLIKRLESARGNGTSMISLIIREWFRMPTATAMVYELLTCISLQHQRIKYLVQQRCWLKNLYVCE